MFASLARTAGLTVTAARVLAAGGGVLGPSKAKAQTPWVAPEPEKAKKSPLPNDKKTVEQGEKIATINCVACHGAGGKGDGPAAVALNPKPADWTSKRVQDDTDGELFWKITTGARRHAGVAAPARERPLGPRPVHPLARREVTPAIPVKSSHPEHIYKERGQLVKAATGRSTRS